MNSKEAISALGALAQEHRLAIFRLLVEVGPGGLSAGEISKSIGISPTSLSFHLKELEHSGLLTMWRDGRFVRSAVQIDGIRKLLMFLTDDCCNGNPDICGGLFNTSAFCND